MKNKFFAMFDYLLLLAIFILIGMGIMFIYSSSINSEGISVTKDIIGRARVNDYTGYCVVGGAPVPNAFVYGKKKVA